MIGAVKQVEKDTVVFNSRKQTPGTIVTLSKMYSNKTYARKTNFLHKTSKVIAAKSMSKSDEIKLSRKNGSN